MTLLTAHVPARLRAADALLAALAIAVIALMVLPLPAALLDGLIALNIALSVLLLMMAMYVGSPLALSTFPALLLFTTLLRLSLNIASTRAILLHGHAGQVIDTFGRLVVGGSVAVGIVVFLIIAIVQFIVIAKGAERVAEVGARFTLDALPGKQMSIEAELRAGLVDKDESQQRRDALSRESQWFGAMDGAMKFVKGDAIAGLLIAAVNIIAGIAIGVAVQGMAPAEAIARYTILTVGDGLVSQIPSLFVSLAAGVLVTRVSRTGTAASGANLAGEIGGQLVAQPRALAATAAVLALFVAVPGLPKLPFLVGTLVLAAGALRIERRQARRAQTAPPLELALPRDSGARASAPTPIAGSLVCVEPVRVRLARSFEAAFGDGRIDAGMRGLRAGLTQQLGVPFPGLRVGIDAALPAQTFLVLVNEVPAARAEGDCEAMLESLRRTLARHAADFIGLQETRDLLNETAASYPDLVAEANKTVPTTRLNQVQRRLVEEGVSIRNQRDILQAMIEWSPKEKDPTLLTEYVRQALSPQIGWSQADTTGTVRAVGLTREAEERIRGALKPSAHGSFLALDAQSQAQFAARIVAARDQAAAQRAEPVCVIASMDIRRQVKRLTELQRPDVAVLSYQELGARIRLDQVATVADIAAPYPDAQAH